MRKHDVSFAEAATVLDRPDSVDEADLADPSRTITIGYSIRARVLLVVSGERGERTRIISARKATPHEQARYHRGG